MSKTKMMSLAIALGIMLAGCSGDSDGGSTPDPVATDPLVPDPIVPDPVVPEYHPYDAPPIEEALKAEYIEAVNNERAAGADCGEYGYFEPAQPVEWSNALYLASYEHSIDMGVVGENSPDIAHIGSSGESDWTAQILELGRGSEFWERVDNNGARAEGVSAYSENAHGYPDNLELAMKDWMESDGHCANIMAPSATHFGMAVIENPDSQLTYYWTQVFGTTLPY